MNPVTAGKRAAGFTGPRSYSTKEKTPMWRRVQGPIVGLFLGLIMLAGCAAGDGGNVASAGGGDQGAAPSEAASKDPKQAALDYVECLREHGLDVDDPGPDGRLKLKAQGKNAEKA